MGTDGRGRGRLGVLVEPRSARSPTSRVSGPPKGCLLPMAQYPFEPSPCECTVKPLIGGWRPGGGVADRLVRGRGASQLAETGVQRCRSRAHPGTGFGDHRPRTCGARIPWQRGPRTLCPAPSTWPALEGTVEYLDRPRMVSRGLGMRASAESAVRLSNTFTSRRRVISKGPRLPQRGRSGGHSSRGTEHAATGRQALECPGYRGS